MTTNMDRATLSEEDRVNAMRGYKAAINNPRVSEEAKQHARDVLDNELGGDAPSFAIYEAQDAGKEPTRVAGGLKAALRNPRVSDAAKESAREQLDQMNQYMTERDKSSDRPEGRLK
ncbi:Conidiation protein 6-domain-containing protein [Thermoascus aurantiacus ATCC 26904]